MLIALAGVTGADAGTAEQARTLFAATEGIGAAPAVTAAAVEVVASTADAAEHAEIERRWREAATPQDEQRYLTAVGVDPRRAALRPRPRSRAPRCAPRTPRTCCDGRWPTSTGRSEAWAYLARDWDHLTVRLPATGLPRMLEGIRGFTDEALARSVEAFLAVTPSPPASSR